VSTVDGTGGTASGTVVATLVGDVATVTTIVVGNGGSGVSGGSLLSTPHPARRPKTIHRHSR
jgi:hypothetical protein